MLVARSCSDSFPGTPAAGVFSTPLHVQIFEITVEGYPPRKGDGHVQFRPATGIGAASISCFTITSSAKSKPIGDGHKLPH